MCSLASEQHKGAATVYRVSYRWGNMFFYLLLFLLCHCQVPKRSFFYHFYLSYVAVETKTRLMIQFPLLVIWENRQLCAGELLYCVKDAFEKKTPSECFKDFKKSFEIWNAKISGKIFVIRTQRTFYTSDFPLLHTGNDKVLPNLGKRDSKRKLSTVVS